jgi:hypothetical protein
VSINPFVTNSPVFVENEPKDIPDNGSSCSKMLQALSFARLRKDKSRPIFQERRAMRMAHFLLPVIYMFVLNKIIAAA